MDWNSCTLCPRNCHANRKNKNSLTGICHEANHLRLARAAFHFWEEPCISGEQGSGTIFFLAARFAVSFVKTTPLRMAVSEKKFLNSVLSKFY